MREVRRGGSGQGRDDAQAAGLGDGCGQLGPADPHHPALDDGMLDPHELSETWSAA